jgi:hypothetical protein
MDSIARIYPDAVFVMTHRDPVKSLASLCKITAAIRRSRSGEVDLALIGRQMREFVRVHFERMMASRQSTAIERRVIDVNYYRLVDAPEIVMADVYRALGMEIPLQVQSAVAGWRVANPPGKRGVNRYTLEAYGLDPEEVSEEYAHYYARFDVPREHQAAAGAA